MAAALPGMLPRRVEPSVVSGSHAGAAAQAEKDRWFAKIALSIGRPPPGGARSNDMI